VVEGEGQGKVARVREGWGWGKGRGGRFSVSNSALSVLKMMTEARMDG
jgi:hypothetical protein